MSNTSPILGGAKRTTGTHFIIFIDKARFETDQSIWTGPQLLALAGKNPPQNYQIFEKKPGGQLEEIKPGQTVDLREPGVERFVTLPLDQTEGADAPPRRQYALPERDTEFLDCLGLRWEAVRDGPLGRLVIHEYPVPRGYNVDRVRLNLRVEPTYPDTQVDMVYFLPHLARMDGRPIGALSCDAFDGETWQRWSRHRTQANPWRPGIDDISTHLALVDSWLRSEIAKAA